MEPRADGGWSWTNGYPRFQSSRRRSPNRVPYGERGGRPGGFIEKPTVFANSLKTPVMTFPVAPSQAGPDRMAEVVDSDPGRVLHSYLR